MNNLKNIAKESAVLLKMILFGYASFEMDIIMESRNNRMLYVMI